MNRFQQEKRATIFQRALRALEKRYLGSGEEASEWPGMLAESTDQCETSVKKRIWAASSIERLPIFNSGVEALAEQLSALGKIIYDDCLHITLRNLDQIDVPADEFADSFTQRCISTFLMVNGLHREGRETKSNGRVGQFIRHVCLDYSDRYPGRDCRTEASGETTARDNGLSPSGEKRVFKLPQWFSIRWRGRAKLALLAQQKGYAKGLIEVPPDTDCMSIAETEAFIVETETIVVERVQKSIFDAHQDALIALDL
jgi:hypothetical protein